MKILQMPCLRGAFMKALVGGSWKVLLSIFGQIRASRAFNDNLVKFS